MKRIASALPLLLVALPASAQVFQPGKLPAASRDSFEVVYQGQPIGTFVIGLSRAGETFSMVTSTRLAAMGMVSVDSLAFGATSLAPSAMSTSLSMQGMTANTSVLFKDGKATGSAQQLGPGGVQTTTVDAAVAPGVIPDGAEFVLLATAPLSDGYTTTYLTFDAKTGKTITNELKVLGKETISIPLGSFETYKVQLSANETGLAYVTVAEPRRIMMLRLEAQQVEMRRVK